MKRDLSPSCESSAALSTVKNARTVAADIPVIDGAELDSQSEEDYDPSESSAEDEEYEPTSFVPPEGYAPASAPKDRVVFFGDSDIEAWNLSRHFPDAVNCGIGATTIEEAAAHVDKMVEDCRPRGWVVFIAGENDLGADSDSEDDDAAPIKMPDASINMPHFKKIVHVLNTSFHKPRVIYVGTKPAPLFDEEDLKVHQAYDKMAKEYVDSLAKTTTEGAPAPVIFIDAFQRFSALGNPGFLYKKDGQHLSKKGYALYTKWVKEAMGEQYGRDEDILLAKWSKEVARNEAK